MPFALDDVNEARVVFDIVSGDGLSPLLAHAKLSGSLTLTLTLTGKNMGAEQINAQLSQLSMI